MNEAELVPGFIAQSPLEWRLWHDPDLRRGLAWCCPQHGHPEGSVGRHVANILARIGRHEPNRSELRLLALLHDSFKGRVNRSAPWSPGNDHAVLARRFAERHVSDERLLAVLELHDAPYWIWRRGGDLCELDEVLDRIPDPELFRRFVSLDASTPGKQPAFLHWFLGAFGDRRAAA